MPWLHHNHQSPKIVFKNTRLDHGGLEMKFTDFHYKGPITNDITQSFAIICLNCPFLNACSKKTHMHTLELSQLTYYSNRSNEGE